MRSPHSIILGISYRHFRHQNQGEAEEGRRRALLEQRMADRALAQDKERLELRSHVLTLRESEMEARVQERDRTIAELTGRIDTLTGMLQKEQATRDSVSRRLSAVEAELSAAGFRVMDPPDFL